MRTAETTVEIDKHYEWLVETIISLFLRTAEMAVPVRMQGTLAG